MSFALREGPKATNWSNPETDVFAILMQVNSARGERSIGVRAGGPRLLRGGRDVNIHYSCIQYND